MNKTDLAWKIEQKRLSILGFNTASDMKYGSIRRRRIKMQIRYWLKLIVSHILKKSFLKFCIPILCTLQTSNPLQVLNFSQFEKFFQSFVTNLWSVMREDPNFSWILPNFHVWVGWRLTISNEVQFSFSQIYRILRFFPKCLSLFCDNFSGGTTIFYKLAWIFPFALLKAINNV